MSASKKNTTLPTTPQIVGTIHSAGSLKRALTLKPGEVDALELRVDHFADSPDVLLKAAERLNFPLILTVRHPKEGGANSLSAQRRRDLYMEFLALATYMDVELRSVDSLRETMEQARAAGVHVSVSDHHFRSTPALAALNKRLGAARKAGADIFKLAATVNTAADLARLFTFFTSAATRQPLSTMGMGPFGKVSRILFARSGSLLNYGYLDQPQVPGQWEARLLKKRVEELEAVE